MSSKLHRTALSYARQGIPVFPCIKNGKQPACARGFHDATIDENIINRWWETEPDYNVAIYPGAAGILVIDEEFDSTDDWLAGDLPETFTVKTPRGGYHYYFEGSAASTVRKLGNRTDTRGEGGYVLVAPSVVGGNAYKIEANLEIAPLPQWVADRLAAPDRRLIDAPDVATDLSANVIRAVAHLASLPPVVEGHGSDDAAFKAVTALRELGLSPGKAYDVMREHFRCAPLDDDWLHGKVHNGYRYAQNAPGASAVGDAAATFAPALSGLLAQPETVPEKRSRFHPEDDDEMDQTPAARWVIKDVLQEGSTVMLYGPTQSYKSFVAIDLAMAIATGRESFGQVPSVTGPVFYGALEGRADVKRTRRPAWRLAKGVEGKTEFYVLPAPMLVFPEEVGEFINQIEIKCAGRMPRMIVLDTVSKMMVGLDATHDAPKLIRFCEGLVEKWPGCTVLAVHHSGHDINKGPRDSSAYRAGFDTVLQVTAPAKRTCEVKVIKHKDSDEPEAPFTFKLVPIGKSLVLQPTTSAEHAELSGSDDAEDDPLDRRAVGAALKTAGLYGSDAGIGSVILADMLLPKGANEAAEARAKDLEDLARKLSRGAKKDLKAYVSKRGGSLVWHLPAREDASG